MVCSLPCSPSACLPRRSSPPLLPLSTAVAISCGCPPTRQTTVSRAAARCPSQGRMGGLCSESRGRSGTLLCTYRPGAVSGQQSARELVSAFPPVNHCLVIRHPLVSSSCAPQSTYMLVDQDNANVLALGGKALEGSFDGRRVGFVVNDQKVLLGIRAGRHMLSGQ